MLKNLSNFVIMFDFKTQLFQKSIDHVNGRIFVVEILNQKIFNKW